jgi:hypothetical protein
VVNHFTIVVPVIFGGKNGENITVVKNVLYKIILIYLIVGLMRITNA